VASADRSSELDQLLAEQVAYYRAVAHEYEDHALPFAGGDELPALSNSSNRPER